MGKIMSEHESFEFKYSIPKLLIRICIGAIITVSGGFATYHFYLPSHTRFGARSIFEFPIWFWIAFIVAAVGITIFSDNILNLFMNKRVFLCLTVTGLQYNQIWPWDYVFIFRIPIPDTKTIVIKWNQIEDARIRRNILLGKEIKITYSEQRKKRTRIRKYGIPISCSKYSAEYILQTIKKNIGEN